MNVANYGNNNVVIVGKDYGPSKCKGFRTFDR